MFNETTNQTCRMNILSTIKKSVALILLSIFSTQTFAHTNSIGYVSNGGGSATFWYGNWHDTGFGGSAFNEGGIRLLGVTGVTYNTTVSFNLTSTTLPTGLLDGSGAPINYFNSVGGALVLYRGDTTSPYSSVTNANCAIYDCTSYIWQGATFSGLSAGTYQFTYMPISNPSPDWDPVDSAILSSNIVLTNEFLSGGTLYDLNPNSYGLRSAFNLQSATLNAGLSYDCKTFDINNICVSAGGRYTNVDNPSANTTGALLIAAYRASEKVRVGGFLDQNLTTHNTNGIDLRNSNPMGGMFIVWNQNIDGTGLEARLAGAYNDKDLTVTRNSGLNSEAGSGSTSLISKAISASISYGKQLGNSNWIASPYAGIRHVKITRDAYTENNSIANPLTYSSLREGTTIALLGLRLNGRITERTNVMGTIGLEQDLNHNVGNYAATGIDPLSFNANIKNTRGVAGFGASFAISQKQVLGVNALYRTEAFQSSASATGLVTYEVGF